MILANSLKLIEEFNYSIELQFRIWKRLQRLRQVRLIRACSFLFVRFRPGAEAYSVLFSLRNVLVGSAWSALGGVSSDVK